jgi:hypothetical protein
VKTAEPHFDVWNYGSNFFNVDILFSNANESANNSAGGSTEFNAVYRGQFGPDKVFGINTAFGPISAVKLRNWQRRRKREQPVCA